MIAYNDLEPSEKVKIYDKGVHRRSRAIPLDCRERHPATAR
jgi:hypothetical protein